jgi:hypothetical protein
VCFSGKKGIAISTRGLRVENLARSKELEAMVSGSSC